MVYYFESGNADHQAAVEEWVNKQNGSAAMLFPVFRDQNNNPFTKPVERFDVSSANPQFLQNLIVNYFDDLIKFTILHQSGTTSAIPGGLGSAVAEAHETTFDALVKMDALMLQDTYTSDLVGPWYRQNKPGIAPGKFEYNIDTPNAQSMVETAQAVVSMGGSIPMEPILSAAGIPAATKGQTILGGPQPSQPAAVGAIPDGTPMVGAGDDGSQPVS
jgi:phage gp29-like protein